MTLQYKMDSLEGLDEDTAKLYIQRDGKYFLDVTGHEQTVDRDSIPRSRLNQEIDKRKASEAALKEVADKLIEDVPEDKRPIVPDLSPAAKIAWLRDAFKMGFFENQKAEAIDSKRPADKPPTKFEGMTPTQMMSQGYTTTK